MSVTQMPSAAEENKSAVMLQYNVADYRTAPEFLTLLAKKRGFLQKGGNPNLVQAATVFLDDWTGAKLSYHCKIPDNLGLPAYMTATLVTDMWTGLDRNQLESGNQNTLSSVKFPNQSSSISFMSKSPTAGLLVVNNIPEEVAKPAEKEVLQPELRADQTNADEAEPVSPKGKTKQVQFQSAHIETVCADDAYDFNTDFV